MALATFGIIATLGNELSEGVAPKAKRCRRQINSDQLVALIVAFHLWWILCNAGVLRSDSVRDNFCFAHLFFGELCENEGQDGFPVESLMMYVKEKGKKRSVLKKTIQHKDPLLCCFVAIGLMLFTLFHVMNIEPPAIVGGDKKGMLNMRIFPFGFGTGAIDIFRDTTSAQQTSMLATVSTELKTSFPALSATGMKKLHLPRKTATQNMKVFCGIFVIFLNRLLFHHCAGCTRR